jgi:hypothetical protein
MSGKVAIPPERLLGELDELVRAMPTFRDERETQAWAGRAVAILKRWDAIQGAMAQLQAPSLAHDSPFVRDPALQQIMTIIEEARYDLRLQIGGTVSAVIPTGSIFEYFDEIRKVIDTATRDVLFVDPYLDAEFVPRYLPHIKPVVKIRLLTEKRPATLLPAVDLYAQQHSRAIAVRSRPGLHDRFVFIDGKDCYLSGASFKDGAKKAPATLVQVKDGLQTFVDLYESMWAAAKVERV